MDKREVIASLGQVMQLAFVPADFDAAAKFWIETMGAGPFFALDHVQLQELTYMGEPTDADFSMLLGHWGDMQIEIIRQHNDAPSIYKAWRDEGREGLQHVCIVVDDMTVVRRTLAAADAAVVQEGKIAGGGEFLYADAGGGPGTMLEVLKPAPGGREFFAMMRDAARNWDGINPIRKLG